MFRRVQSRHASAQYTVIFAFCHKIKFICEAGLINGVIVYCYDIRLTCLVADLISHLTAEVKLEISTKLPELQKRSFQQTQKYFFDSVTKVHHLIREQGQVLVL